MEMLNQRNKHPRDEHVSFEADTHTYSIHGSSLDVTSVTTLLADSFPAFDADAVIDKYNPRWQQNPLRKEYYGKTKEEIKEMWETNAKEAAEEGTRMHAAIEAFYNDQPDDYDQDRTEWKQFLAFQKEHQLQAYRTEMVLWSSDHKLGGMVDMVVQNEDGTYSLYDWKRSKKPIEQGKNFSWGRSGKGPLEHLKDTNYSKYSIQLNLYRELLERYYDFQVSSMYIVRFHPDAKQYELVKVERMEEEANALLQERETALKKKKKLEAENEDGEAALLAGLQALAITSEQ